jgi:hypothetical protein
MNRMERTAVGAAVVAVLVAVAAGCSGSSSPATTTRPTVPPVAPIPTAAAREMTRACDAAVGGHLPGGWMASSMRSGPLVLWAFGAVSHGGRVSTLAPSTLRPVGYVKMLASVRPGAVVTLSVPAAEQKRISLAYAMGQSPAHVSRGYAQVTLKACAQPSGGGPGFQGWTQFNGGLVAAGAQCAVLDVQPSGEAKQQMVVALCKAHC